MKTRWLAICLILGGAAWLSPAAAQNPVSSDPREVMKRRLGDGGGGSATTGVRETGKKQTVTVHYTAVSPLREWKNAEGKRIEARLLAFSAPEDGETGPIEVIREGRVRFLTPGAKAPVDYPLDQLDPADRQEIEGIARAALGGAPEEKDEESGEDDDGAAAPQTEP